MESLGMPVFTAEEGGGGVQQSAVGGGDTP